jgi:hypothetical protein
MVSARGADLQSRQRLRNVGPGKIWTAAWQRPSDARIESDEMVRSVEQSIEIDASVDSVWQLLSNFGDLSWMPGIEGVALDGDVRTVTLASGRGRARERLVLHSCAARTITYVYIDGPLPLKEYESTIVVASKEGRTKVIWRAVLSTSPVIEDEVVGIINKMYTDALCAVAQRFDALPFKTNQMV